MRSHSSWLLAGAAIAPLAAPAAAQAQPYRFHFDHVLGTSLDLTATAPDETSALMAVTAARREIERLDPILSAWRADSELEQLNRSQALAVSPDLYAVLDRCEHWRAATGGAFDCRIGGALALWREAEATGGDVDAVRLDRILAVRGTVRLDPAGQVVARPQDVRFTVDGLAKGYVIDAAMAAARRASPNLTGLMIDIGGDLSCWGASPLADGWRVGVAAAADPADNGATEAVLRLDGGAVAASGRGARDLRVQGCAVSHTLDPTSGRPVAAVQRAVVVARSAADADALATAFMVMPPHRAVALADRLDGVETLIADTGGGAHASRGWNDLVDRGGRPRLIRTAAAAERGFTLDIGYQTPKLDAEPYHAPYVVVWVTDADHKPVRTLLVLGTKPRWVPENYVWWRRYGRQMAQPLDSIARPTRLPGKYALHWDGRDEAGKAAPPGRYIVHIEAAREKGGHTYQTVDLDLGGAAGTRTLPAKDEMGAVELRYGPDK